MKGRHEKPLCSCISPDTMHRHGIFSRAVSFYRFGPYSTPLAFALPTG